MDISARLTARRREFEASADALFDQTWSGVRALATPFKFELDAMRAPSGGWRDFFAATPFRPLDLPILLLEDLGAPTGDARDRVERTLFDAAALSAAAVLVHEVALGAEVCYGPAHTLLAPGLVTSAALRLAEVARDPVSLRDRALGYWNECAEALYAERTRRIRRATPFSSEDVGALGRRWAPLKAPVVCSVESAGGAHLLGALLPCLDEAAALFQLGRELGRLGRDLARGLFTVPIEALWRSLGGALPLDHPPDAERVLLAAIVTRTIPSIAGEALRRHAALLSTLDGLGDKGLPHTRAALVGLREPFDQALAHYASEAPAPPPPRERAFVVSHRPQAEQVLQAAAALFRADPECQEAWEVNRWRYLNEVGLTCRVFPTGVVLENRIAAGDSCGAEVDALFERYALNRFSYYEQPCPMPPDGDTLGLMLRLAAHAATPARCRAHLETPLGWMLQNLGPDGEIPVFLTTGVDARDDRGFITPSACGCAAVQAAILLGLLAFDPLRFGAVVTRGAQRTLDAVARGGGASFWFYEVPYGVFMTLALTSALRRERRLGDALDAAIVGCERRCLALLEAQRSHGPRSSQDAALLWLASGFTATRALRDPAWIEQLLREQRIDGAWNASPLYIVPSRGNLVDWHSSRLLSSSFAYRALAEGHRHG